MIYDPQPTFKRKEMMAIIGYARVSTRGQTADSQVDILKAAGCERIFMEHASGTLAARPELNAALSYLREGDLLVVTKLDRLGRSVKNLSELGHELQVRGIGLKAVTQDIDTTTIGGRLFFNILAAIAEFEHDMIVERTQEGLAAARARGRTGGPKFKMTDKKVEQARRMYDTKKYTVAEIAQAFGVARSTIYRHLEEQPIPGKEQQ